MQWFFYGFLLNMGDFFIFHEFMIVMNFVRVMARKLCTLVILYRQFLRLNDNFEMITHSDNLRNLSKHETRKSEKIRIYQRRFWFRYCFYSH